MTTITYSKKKYEERIHCDHFCSTGGVGMERGRRVPTLYIAGISTVRPSSPHPPGGVGALEAQTRSLAHHFHYWGRGESVKGMRAHIYNSRSLYMSRPKRDM